MARGAQSYKKASSGCAIIYERHQHRRHQAPAGADGGEAENRLRGLQATVEIHIPVRSVAVGVHRAFSSSTRTFVILHSTMVPKRGPVYSTTLSSTNRNS